MGNTVGRKTKHKVMCTAFVCVCVCVCVCVFKARGYAIIRTFIKIKIPGKIPKNLITGVPS